MQEFLAQAREILGNFWRDLTGLASENSGALLYAAVWVVVVLVMLWIVKSWVKDRTRRTVYVKRERVLTKNELRLFQCLQKIAAEKGLVVFPMLRVSELIRVKKQTSRKRYYKFLNQISRKHIDFTLCDAEDNRIFCCVELQDLKRDAKNLEKRDAFIMELFAKTEIPLARVKSSREEYDAEALWAMIEEAVDRLKLLQEQRKAANAGKKSAKKRSKKRRKRPQAAKPEAPAVPEVAETTEIEAAVEMTEAAAEADAPKELPAAEAETPEKAPEAAAEPETMA